MTVFLGDGGRILLRRKGSEQSIFTIVNDSDVREDVDRFSIDFAHEQIITGDRIEIRTTGGEDITWIDHPDVDNSFTRFAHVDAAGGVRLYESFPDAISDNKTGAVSLIAPTTPQEVEILIANSGEDRCLAEVTSYQITTTRETIDTTHLGAHYRKQYEAGLIQGQGQIECLWRQPGSSACEHDGDGQLNNEFASYLARLCIRLVHGAAFHGQFYIYAAPTNNQSSVWYESETCIVTNVAVTVEPTQTIQTTIDFVTSGPIVLRKGYQSGFLELEETEFYVATEGTDSGAIELENPE